MRETAGRLRWAVVAAGLVVARCVPPAGTSDSGALQPAHDPSPTLRRLSRAEYVRTLQDLLGDYEVRERDLPADQVSYLLPNVASAQSLSRLDLERYVSVANAVATRAWSRRTAAPVTAHPSDEGTGPGRTPASGFDGWASRLDSSRDDASVRLDLAYPGRVRLRVHVRPEAQPSGPLTLRVVQGRDTLGSVDVSATYPDGGDVFATVEPDWLTVYGVAGAVRLGLAVDGASPTASVLVQVPDYEAGVLTAEQVLPSCDESVDAVDACARRVLTPLVRRAWRRPVAASEIDPLVELAAARRRAGDTFDEAVKTAVAGVLVSPRFLFRVEAPVSTVGADEPVDAHEFATRLSYFLWGSMPDAELRAAADSGAILHDDEAQRQLARMVADRRFNGFVRGFAGHWLGFVAVGAGVPDARPSDVWPETLESEMFVTRLFRDNAPLASLLTSTSTTIEGSLASRYDYPEIGPTELDRWVDVDLAGLPRKGFLTQASFLTVSSPGGPVTEPTVRGYFVLARLLCDPPPPPPRVFDNFTMSASPDLPLRASLEAHRSNPACSSCHDAMDPIGFGLESYNVVGRYRADIDHVPIDTSGSVASLGDFRGASDLVDLIARSPLLAPCAIKNVMTYALGRGDLDPNADGLDVVRAQVGTDVRLLDLLRAVVRSPSFRARAPQQGY